MTSIKYPLELNNGDLALELTYSAEVAQTILETLSTYIDERVMSPEFGIDIYPFDARSVPNILGHISAALVLTLKNYPDVTYQVLGNLADQDGQVEVVVRFNIGDQRFQVRSVV